MNPAQHPAQARAAVIVEPFTACLANYAVPAPVKCLQATPDLGAAAVEPPTATDAAEQTIADKASQSRPHGAPHIGH